MDRFITLIEPLLLVIMGIVIAGVVLALYMPLFELSSVASDGGRWVLACSDSHRPLDVRAADPVPIAGADEHLPRRSRARKLAERYRLEFVDMDEFRIDQELFRSIPADLMLRYGSCRSAARRQRARDRRVRPDRPADDRRARRAAGARRSRCRSGAVGDPVDPQEERGSQRVLEDATEAAAAGPQGRRERRGQPHRRAADERHQPDHPAGGLDDLHAIQRRASDIHIETGDDEVHVKYRIDGVLQPAMQPIAKQFHSAIISRIKVMAELDIAEKRVPQDGRFKVRMPGKTIDFRVSIMPTVHGEDAVIRILDKESISEQFTELRLDILGFPTPSCARFRKYIREPYGMVLVTGPTGSGKTTTLYAALSEIKTAEDKIITIEDPVEYQLPGITQIPVNEKKGSDLRARPALDPAPRPRQDHGGRDPRPRDGADRHPVGAHRPPGVHDRPRQQRGRRAGPLPEHGRRARTTSSRP